MSFLSRLDVTSMSFGFECVGHATLPKIETYLINKEFINKTYKNENEISFTDRLPRSTGNFNIFHDPYSSVQSISITKTNNILNVRLTFPGLIRGLLLIFLSNCFFIGVAIINEIQLNYEFFPIYFLVFIVFAGIVINIHKGRVKSDLEMWTYNEN